MRTFSCEADPGSACLQYFPIIAEDYEGTQDRPGCENPESSPHFAEQGHLLHCNTRLNNLTRLDHVLQGTLRKCVSCLLVQHV